MPVTFPSISPAQAARLSPTTSNAATNPLYFIALFSFLFVPGLFLRVSEDESRDQINRVIAACIATGSVIVVRSAVELRVSRVLRGELQVLPWPEREVGD